MTYNLRIVCIITALYFAFIPPNSNAHGKDKNVQAKNLAILADLDGQHPEEYFGLAKKYFERGQKDEAVFAFYIGQLRYRIYIAARPELPEDQDPAVFSSLMATIGSPINEYAFGDITRLSKTLDLVLNYNTQNPDNLTPREKYPQAHETVRKGLIKLKQYILANRDSIQQQRTVNGLENRN